MPSIGFRKTVLRFALGTTFVFLMAATAAAETGAEAWLRYYALSPQSAKTYQHLPRKVVVLGDSAVLKTAQQELVLGAAQILGETLRVSENSSPENAIILGTLTRIHALAPALHPPQNLEPDGYWLKIAKIHGFECLVIGASTDRGVLYGVLALLGKIALGEVIADIDEVQRPFAPIRWVNQWDNLDGRIER